MPVKCKDIAEIIEAMAPRYLTLEGDNTGLIIGDEDSEVKSILVALDINMDVYNEAVSCGANLIVTHHPVIYSPIKSINLNNFKGRIIHKLISSNINVYSAHTNLDVAEGGVNDFLADRLQLCNVSLLEKTYEEKLFKLAVYVPRGYEQRVRNALTGAGAGHIGNYSNCTFNIDGTGTFKPLSGTKPFIGSIDTEEFVKEVKIETIVPSAKLYNVINTMLDSHPYEEPAYDVYALENNIKEYGIGRVGYIKGSVSLRELCERVKNILNVKDLNVVGDLGKSIKKVAVCSGSGADFIESALNMGCDAYLTGDIKYHDACDARDMGIAVIDAGHFATENVYMAELCNYIKQQILKRSYSVNVVLSCKNRNPFIRV